VRFPTSSRRPVPAPGARRWREVLLPCLISLAFAALCTTSLLRKNGVYDEYYVGIGARLSRPEALFHPPLSFVLHSLPFLWWDVPEAVWEETDGQLRGQKMVALRGDDWILNASRLALLPVGMALGWIVFAWARRLYGWRAGLLSMTLLSFDPNVIAHARLITPDTTLACTTLLTAFLLWRLADAPGRRGRILAGIALGLMLLSKYTALLLVPILGITDLGYRLLRARGSPPLPVLARAARDWLTIATIGVSCVFAGYGFDAGLLELRPGLEIPVIARRYVEGALFQWQQSRQPHDFFLMGQHSTQGWWYFYLVVFALKVPLATLALLVLRIAGGRRLGWPAEAREIYLWLPALLLLAYLSLWNTIHNGFRYLLPVYPLLLVGLGRCAEPGRAVRRVRSAVAVAAAWVVGGSLWIWPDYLAYANELIGGPRNAYRWLSDSNLDWGQDLKQLKAWMERHGVERVQLAYFGTADPAHYGIEYSYLPSANSRLRPTPPLRPEEAPRIVALSAYQYQGVGLPRKDFYAFFQRHEPNALVGYSILIFDLDHLIPRGER
jgi:hypothetical protein